MHDGLMALPHDGSRTLSRTGAALTRKRFLMGVRVVSMMLCVRVLFPTDGNGGAFAFEITDMVRNWR
jgi:hypothetical protein